MSDTVNLDSLTDEQFEEHLNNEILNYGDSSDEDVQVEDIGEISGDSVDQSEEENEEEAESNEDTEEDSTEQSQDEEEDNQNPDSDDSSEENSDESMDEESDQDSSEPESDEDTSNESDEDNSNEVDTEDVQKNDKYKIRADGMDLELNLEELSTLAKKGVNYTRKMQEIKPYRKMISAIKDENISEQDFNLMIDALKGDKNALASVLKRNNTDVLSLEEVNADEYKPKSYGKSEIELNLSEEIKKIENDVEYPITDKILNSWDEASLKYFIEDTSRISLLHEDVKSGTYKEVSAIANKMKQLDDSNKSDIEYYLDAGKVYFDRLALQEQKSAVERLNKQKQEEALKASEKAKIEQAKKAKEKDSKIKAESIKRKAAGIPNKSTGKTSVIDYLDSELSDDDFEKEFEKLLNAK